MKSPKVKMMNFIDGRHEIKEGMKVFVTNGQSGSHFNIYATTVEKIGREFVTVNSNSKYSLATGIQKTEYGAKGQMFSSKEAWEQYSLKVNRINRLTSQLSSYSFKPTYEQAIAIANILGLDLDKDQS